MCVCYLGMIEITVFGRRLFSINITFSVYGLELVLVLYIVSS